MPLSALKLEGECFHIWKDNAWERDLPRTPKGMENMQEVFNDVNVREFHVNLMEDES